MLSSINNTVSAVQKRISGTEQPTEHKLLMVGLSFSGKTALTYYLKLNEIVSPVTTIHFNIEHITFQRTNFAIWDLGGRQDSLWRHFTKDTVGVVYVVDSSAEDFMEEAKDVLWRLFTYNDELKDAVLLVFANKQDRLDAMSVTEVKDRLELETRARRLRWHIQGSSVVSGDGLVEGMAWMTAQLKGRTWRHAL